MLPRGSQPDDDAVVVPMIGESLLRLRILRWLRKVGEEVAAGELLYEITTDKIDAVVEAPKGGTLVAILATEGEVVTPGQTVARIAPRS